MTSGEIVHDQGREGVNMTALNGKHRNEWLEHGHALVKEKVIPFSGNTIR